MQFVARRSNRGAVGVAVALVANIRFKVILGYYKYNNTGTFI